MAEVKYLDKTGLTSVWSKVKGIVTPKADKVSGATAGHLAGLNSGGNLVDSGLAADNIAQKDGSYSGMTVGAAEDLVSAKSVASEFTLRITGGSTAVGKGGTALVDKIKGRTLVLNQLIKNAYIHFTYDNSAGTSTASGDMFSGAAGGFDVVNGHKYAIIWRDTNSSVRLRNVAANFQSNYLTSSIWTAPATTTDGLTYVRYAVSAGAIVDTYINVTDLTLMFGAGNEPSTFAEFEALYPLPYYNYNLGKPINNGLQSEYDLVWNQLLANGNFANGSTGWSPYNSTLSASNGELTIEKTSASASTGAFARTSITGDTTHKYYMACDAEMLTSGVELYLGFHTTGGTVGGNAVASTASSSYQRISQVASPVSSTDTFSIRVGAAAAPGGSTGKAKNVILVDLTLMFGAGNEPASPEEFEAMFPADYYPYDTGTQQHFSFPQFKTKIETEGWNLVDIDSIFSGISGWQNFGGGEWYVPSGKANTGTKVWENIFGYTGQVHIHYERKAIKGLNGERLQFYYTDGSYESCNPSTVLNTYQTGNFLSNGSKIVDYIALTFGTGSHDCYLKNICISLSDPSRNGTYEPYWRSELELGLGDIKVKSHNLWDEEWEAGGIDATTGQNDSTINIIRAKNYTPVTGGQSYYIYMGSARASQAISMRYYDANKNLIGTTDKNGSSNGANLVRVMPDNCAYIRFVTSSYYGSSTTYLNDICVNLSDPAFNGRYEPYGDGGVISITGGLKSAGAAYDEISGGKFIKRIESEDMGTPTWNYNSSTAFMYVSGANFPNMPNYGGVICPKYNTIALSELVDKAISTGGDSYRLVVKDSAYTDAATFKAAMAGVPLYYELAQPIEYELADALPTAMRNDPYGTERRLPEDTAAIVTAPFRADITYSTNIKEAVQSLPQNYININSMQDFLAALGTLMGGTWTMRPADGKFDFTFTPNPSNE